MYFDENGHGLINTGSGFVSDPGNLAADPTGRVGGLVLIYTLDPAQLVGNGDVRVWEDYPGATILSDVISFTDANGNLTGITADRMIYYSEGGTRISPIRACLLLSLRTTPVP